MKRCLFSAFIALIVSAAAAEDNTYIATVNASYGIALNAYPTSAGVDSLIANVLFINSDVYLGKSIGFAASARIGAIASIREESGGEVDESSWEDYSDNFAFSCFAGIGGQVSRGPVTFWGGIGPSATTYMAYDTATYSPFPEYVDFLLGASALFHVDYMFTKIFGATIGLQYVFQLSNGLPTQNGDTKHSIWLNAGICLR